MDYALIEDGVVVNLIYLHPMNIDEFPNAKPTNGLPVQIGDTFADDKFYHNGKEVTAPNALTDEDVQRIKDQAIAEVQEGVVNGLL